MIKIFGRQPFFKFHHIIYEYDLKKEVDNSSLICEKIVDDLERINIGYFSIRMLEKVLNHNPDKSECYMFSSADGEVVGFALVSFNGAREIHYRVKKSDAFITALGVFPKNRGKGYSQEILKGVVGVCKEKGLKCLRLSVDSDNVVAINAYEKFGFRRSCEKRFIRVASVDFLFNKIV